MLIKTKKSQAIIDYLKEDLLINLNMIGVIENVPKAEIYVDNVNNPNGVFIKKDYFNYIYSKEDKFINEVCDKFFKDNSYGFSGVKASIAEKIKRKFKVDWENSCTLYYMPKDNLNLNLIKNNVQSIDIKDTEIIHKYYKYKHTGSIEAIKKCIQYRPSSAIYINDEIVSWLLIHNDNSMGIMYTKEEHRRKGYAVDVTIDLVYKVIKNGKIPYIQIVNKNKKSSILATKCGFIECGVVSWFGITAGTTKGVNKLNNQSKEEFLEKFNDENIFRDNNTYDGLNF